MKVYARDGMVFCITGDADFADACYIKAGTRISRFHRLVHNLPRSLVNVFLSEAELIDWDIETADPTLFRLGSDLTSEWTLAGSSVFYVECPSKPPMFKVHLKTRSGQQGIQIVDNLPLTLRAHSACHRCAAKICVAFSDGAGEVLRTDKFSLPPAKGGRREADYHKTIELITPPKRARQADVWIAYDRATEPVESLSSFIFVTKLSLTHIGTDLRPNGLASLLNHGDETREKVCYSANLDPKYLTNNNLDVEIITSSGSRNVIGHAESEAPNGAAILQDGPFKFRFEVPDGIEYSIFFDNNRMTKEEFGIFSYKDALIDNGHLDGNYHNIQIRDTTGCYIWYDLWVLLPYQQTPWAVLQEHGGNNLPEFLSPAAGQRYKSLLFHAKNGKQRSAEQSAAWLGQLEHIHDVLLRGFVHNRRFSPLSFPAYTEPDVSIIVPAHNKFEVTYFCLCAILYSYNEASFEVIVVDDGSSDRTIEIPRLISNVTYVRNDVANGFLRACNEGAKHVRGKYLVLLNNDTEPAFGWLDELLATFKIFADVGLAGSKLIYPDGRLQEAGGIVWNSGNPWNYGRLENPFDPRFCYTREVDYVSGAAIMVPLHVWEAVGGFSEDFTPAYFEDTDLAFKIREAGLKTMLSASSIVYHFEGVTSGTDVREGGAKRFQEINRPKFKRKWRGVFRSHSQEGVTPDLEKDRGVIGRALFIDYATPRTDMDAGSYAAVQEMRLLQKLGYKISFWPMNAAYLGDYFTALQRQGIEMLYSPFFSWIGEVLEQRGREFDVVYITRYYVAQETIELVRRHAPQAKILFCNADLHFLRVLRSAVRKGDDAKITEAIYMRDAELAVMRQVDVTLSYNEVEHAVILSHNLNTGRVMKLPWVEHATEVVRDFDQRDGIAFLGNFQHAPNAEAVEHFASSVMPSLVNEDIDIKFHIFGSNITKQFEKIASKNIVIHGYVREVGEVFDNCKVFVAPLLSGAGIKGKVLSALGRGVPSVLSPTAAEGIGLRHGFECLIAETPDEWVQAILKLIKDKELWYNISKRGQALVRNEYSLSRGVKMMRNIVEALDLPIS